MSKKAPVKKTKRRLKRSIRRSIAAVLMITAIGVAAIPVPENYAEEPSDSSGSGSSTTTGKTDVHDLTNFQYNETGKMITQSDGSQKKDTTYDEKNSSIELDRYENATTKELIANLYKYIDNGEGNNPTIKGDVYPSLNISKVGEQWDLSWQFMYYLQYNPVSEETQGVICKYNSQYSATKVELNLNPITQYYTVEEQKFNDFYAGTDTDGMLIDPTQEVQFSYTNWTMGKGNLSSSGLSQEAQLFFSKYAKEEYEAKIADYAKYDQQDAAYNNGSTTVPDESLKTPLKVIPNNTLSVEDKLYFYCDYDATLSPRGSGYHLESVLDSRIKDTENTGSTSGNTGSTSGNAKFVYVAQGGTPISGSGAYRNDDNDFLVMTVGVKMCAIGNRAFAGVGNVKELDIPQDIAYIGDEAFEKASLMEKITLSNVLQIGNRAFRGCDKLSTVEIGAGTQVIGAECFSQSAVASITLPNTIIRIGYGAFSNCNKLTNLDMDGISQPCEIKDYAFYNCSALTNVAMSKANITRIGDGVFAISAGGANPLGIVMPENMGETDAGCIGDYLFAGRSALEYVVFPKKYGYNEAFKATLPNNMFHGCSNLQYVEFPVNIKTDPYACGYVSYSPKVLFADITNTEFFVRGPEKSYNSDVSKPRESTWEAITAVNDFVPYVFKNSAGVDCYEVAIDGYRYQANKNGELTSCVLVGDTDGNLVIPSNVGNYPITSIVPGCFDNEDLRNSIKTITIEDNSITSIGDGVFKDLPKLTKVIIGNSVSSIGKSAFEGCEKLTDVTFHTPSAGYGNFTIGENAFTTGGSELTFHGDIVEGYAPFEWAMDDEHLIDATEGIRICYKSLAPTYLTVMYDANTKLVTLLDYPKYDQIGDILNETHSIEIADGNYGSYEKMMEQKRYVEYAASKYDEKRKRFAEVWNSALKSEDVETAKKAAYASDDYGPWVNENFCNSWDDYLQTTEDSGEQTVLTVLADMLFEPLIAEAADNPPDPFYKIYPYDVVQNFESGNQYRTLNNEELALLEATEKIVVPAGVESIDTYGFNHGDDSNTNIKKNQNNARIYLDWDIIGTDPYNMYNNKSKTDENTVTDITPGLFSGYYDDNYSEANAGYEQYKRGNDRIIGVTLNSVKYLPDYAFDSCERLQYVILGEDCEDIGTAPFRGCYSLTTVGDNTHYKTDNGIVYSVNTDGSYTIEECLPARGNLVGGSQLSLSTDANLGNVSAIQEGAFEECKYINLVDLSETAGLTEIPEDCFKNCSDLTRLTLPRTVNNIEEGAFVNDLKLVELTIPGTEVFISARAFEENKDKAWTTILTYEDSSARRYADTYADTYKLTYEQKADEWRVIFLDSDLNQVGEAQYVENNTYLSKEQVPECPAKESWTFEKWLGTNNTEVTDRITSDTTFVAQGYSDNGMINGKYSVAFYDQVDGAQIGVTQYIEPGKAAIAPQAPVHTGYSFLKWSSEEYTNVQKNLTIMAMYSGSGTGTAGGGSTNTSGGATTTSGTTTSSNTTSTSTSSTSNTSSSSSTSATSTTAAATGQYVVTVIGGSGSGTYAQGTTVQIIANTPAAGKVFSKWTTDSQGVTLASVSTTPTTFVMPANNVTITAEYTDGTATPAANSVNGTATANNNTNNTGTQDGNTRVDITKPGISNKDLATANVNGSSDNFVVKISETDEATQAVAAALTKKYGSLENILYYAMDISLYDSTGTTKITDTTGLSVDITIPLPDALLSYGGNNMAGAAINYNPLENAQLEEISEKFTTINGIPCITFTATHFSPYTVYVDTGNLTEGMLDVTPKTGDPIHPKWFLSLGLACLSIILFMKKDKNTAKPKTA